jgi:hypothetical protein
MTTTALVLLNPVTLSLYGGQHKLLPGEIVTDSITQALVVEAGGQLVTESSVVLAAAALARKIQAKGQDSTAQTLAMLASLLSQSSAPSTLSTMLTGASSSTTLVLPQTVPIGHSAVLTISALAQVTTVGSGGSESLGDVYSFGARVTVKNVSGSVALVTNLQVVPEIDSDASMAGSSVTPGGSGTSPTIACANGTLLGTGAVVLWTVDVQVRVF